MACKHNSGSEVESADAVVAILASCLVDVLLSIAVAHILQAGDAKVTTCDGTVVMEAQDCVLIPAGTRYDIIE